MKIMSKTKIIKKNSVKNINNERKFLSLLHHPFLVNMICSFQDNDNLYLVMELLLGGDLRYHINKKTVYNRKKDENQLKFIAGCTLVGLNYIHENKIIHKDIKPENLVYDSNGYIHITDFGISKFYHPENGKENSGTPGYMAPEVLFNKDHDYSVDFFSLGVILYELLMGKRPYHGHSKKELRKDIVTRQARINEENVPDGFVRSKNFFDCINFINGLLERKKDRRLGNNGFKEIKEHPWLIDFNWDDLINKDMQPPFIPPQSDSNYDKKYCNEIEKIGEETQKEYNTIKNKIEYNKYFENYTCNNKLLSEINETINEKEKEYEREREREKEKEREKERDSYFINNKKLESLNINEDKKNVFNIKKNINDIFKDKKLIKTFFKVNNQILINHNGIMNNIFSNNNNTNSTSNNNNNEKKTLFEKIQINAANNKKSNRNYYNEISLSTKINSNISTGNLISDYHAPYDKSYDKFKPHHKKIIKDEISLSHNNHNSNFSNSVYMSNFHKSNKNYVGFYKKSQQSKKLPYIYKHLKKSVSVENYLTDKKFNKILGFSKNSERVYNPSTLYGKYFPSKNYDITNKHFYSYLNLN